MKNTYKRWVCMLLAGTAALLAICAAIVYIVDPYFYYRMPTKWEPVFFEERCQAVGLAKQTEADTVLLGTSMSANYRVSYIEEALGGTAVRLTIPDGYFSEFDAVLDVVFREHTPERVIFGLDANILHRDESGKSGVLPTYLCNANPLDDVKYLLNKDALYYSAFTLLTNYWGEGIQSLDDAFTWDWNIWWNHMTALANYTRPEIVHEKTPAEAWAANVEANLQVLEGWLTEHPDTEFDIFFPPYSMLFWDKTTRRGETEAVFAALEQACRRLLEYDNVKLYGFLWEPEIVENLDNYCDYIHHSGTLCQDVLARIAADDCLMTKENMTQTLANWQDFVVNYDYEKFWDKSFWTEWNAQHQK